MLLARQSAAKSRAATIIHPCVPSPSATVQRSFCFDSWGGGIGAGTDEGCTSRVRARGGWMGPFPSPGCPTLHRSRITTRTRPALAVNEITATAWSGCRSQCSGHDPRSTRVHGNIATYFNGRRAAGQLSGRAHLAGELVAPSKDRPELGAGQSRVLENQLVSSLRKGSWARGLQSPAPSPSRQHPSCLGPG